MWQGLNLLQRPSHNSSKSSQQKLSAVVDLGIRGFKEVDGVEIEEKQRVDKDWYI